MMAVYARSGAARPVIAIDSSPGSDGRQVFVVSEVLDGPPREKRPAGSAVSGTAGISTLGLAQTLAAIGGTVLRASAGEGANEVAFDLYVATAVPAIAAVEPAEPVRRAAGLRG